MKEIADGKFSRRQMIELLAALGITGPAAMDATGQSNEKLSPEILRSANTLTDLQFTSERLALITPGLQGLLDRFQAVRDMEMDDTVEPMFFRAGLR